MQRNMGMELFFARASPGDKKFLWQDFLVESPRDACCHVDSSFCLSGFLENFEVGIFFLRWAFIKVIYTSAFNPIKKVHLKENQARGRNSQRGGCHLV